MTLSQFKSNNRGCNKAAKDDASEDFDPKLLEGIYNEIKAEEFKFNFAKESPGYTLDSKELQSDKTFKKLNDLLSSPDAKNAQNVFSQLDNNVQVNVSKPRSFLNKLTGYEGSIR